MSQPSPSRSVPEAERLSRRGLLGAGAVAAAGAAGLSALGPTTAGAASPRPRTPDGALKALLHGNARYRRNAWSRKDYSPVGEAQPTAQEPFAAVLTCADSRVSPPLIFDVERGNIFAAHVAGNSIDEGSLGSIEYAVAVLKVRVVMVLGHSDCGAVKAAMHVVDGSKTYDAEHYGAIGAFVDRVVPAVRALPDANRTLGRCVSSNARLQAADLAQRNPIIAPAVQRGEIKVVGAVYDIRTGRVRVV
ncbi:MAG: carbonic anhydrase [Patulibacter sp.]